DDDLHLRDVFAGDLERVLQRSRRDDRRSMLIVMEDGDVHLLLQTIFDLEAFGRGDVLEIDAAERRLERLDCIDEELRVARRELEIEDVDVGESLEENRLPFHDGLARRRSDVAKPED